MVNPKLSPADRRFLADQVCKYLKYLAHLKTASDHTSKSYANDLSQFVFPQGEGRILYSLESTEDPFQIHIVKETRAAHPEDLDAEVARLVHQSLERWSPLTSATRNRKFTVLRGFLSWLFEHKLISKNWRPQLVGPKVQQKIPHFLSLDEVLSIFKTLGAESSPTLLLVSLLYGGGLRVSEACALQWRDLKPESRSVLIRGKGGRERIVVLPEFTWQCLMRFPRSERFVFGDEPLGSRQAYELVRRAGAKAQLLRPLHPHSLRHSYATHLLSSGTDLRVLQELLGHKSLTATQKYTHLSLDHLARSLETFHPLSASKLKKPQTLD